MRAPDVLKASMFIPKRLQKWQPPDVVMRRCHWCASGPRRLQELGVHMVGPMRWYFCSDGCCAEWEQRRFDDDIRTWLKYDAGTRAKVLAGEVDEASRKDCADASLAYAGLCSDSRVALSMCQTT